MRLGKLIAILMLVCGFACVVYAAEDKPVVAMKAHVENGLTCADCHKVDVPEKRAPASACIECHENLDGTYKGLLDNDNAPIKKEYVESAGSKSVNMHDTHQGEIRCTVCHAYHKEPVLYCNECHKFEVKVK